MNKNRIRNIGYFQKISSSWFILRTVSIRACKDIMFCLESDLAAVFFSLGTDNLRQNRYFIFIFYLFIQFFFFFWVKYIIQTLFPFIVYCSIYRQLTRQYLQVKWTPLLLFLSLSLSLSLSLFLSPLFSSLSSKECDVFELEVAAHI